jgi:hypothetical protein
MSENGARNGGEWRLEGAGIGASSWKLRLTELRRACIGAVRGPETGLRWSNGGLGELVGEQVELGLGLWLNFNPKEVGVKF